MSRSTKALIGVLSFLPIILLIAFFVMFMTTLPAFVDREEFDHPAAGEVFRVFGPIFILAMLMGILSLGLLVLFIIHLVRTKNIDTTERIVWVLVLLFAGIIGYPIYWYMRIWKEEQAPL